MLDCTLILLIWLQECRKLFLKDTVRCVCMVLDDEGNVEASTWWRRVSDEGLSVASPHTSLALFIHRQISPYITQMNVRLLQLRPKSKLHFEIQSSSFMSFSILFQTFQQLYSESVRELTNKKASVHTNVWNKYNDFLSLIFSYS